MPDIIYGTTIPPYKSADRDRAEAEAWLRNVEALSDDAFDAGMNLRIFLAAEVDGRGNWVQHRVMSRLRECGVPFDVWHFMIDDGLSVITSESRLHRICAGRNLIVEYALRERAEWVFFVDSDLSPDPQSITKLLALDYPVVGGEVPNYCLTGRKVAEHPCFPGRTYDFPVEAHWNTAGYLMLHQSVLRRIRWGHDNWPTDDNLPRITDDPWTQDLIRSVSSFETLVRKDCIGEHRGLIPMEDRGHDRAWRAPSA
jgi:hypothetical protein